MGHEFKIHERAALASKQWWPTETDGTLPIGALRPTDINGGKTSPSFAFMRT